MKKEAKKYVDGYKAFLAEAKTERRAYAAAVRLLEKAADEIEQELQNELGGEVSSTRIGELVMERLRELDEVAYVRFASVYRQFRDINSFLDELNRLLESKKE